MWIVVVGSTTVFDATLAPTISLPVTAFNTGLFTDTLGSNSTIRMLSASYGSYDISANNGFTNQFSPYLKNATTMSVLALNASTPFTWATGDVLALQGAYEAA
jgi:hypothetical protein